MISKRSVDKLKARSSNSHIIKVFFLGSVHYQTRKDINFLHNCALFTINQCFISATLFDGIFWRGRALVAIRIRESKVRNPDLPDRRRFVLSEHISS